MAENTEPVDTAAMMSVVRSDEARSGRKLFALDRYADIFATAMARRAVEVAESKSPYYRDLVLVRGELFREHIERLLALPDSVHQVVLLGAGYSGLGQELAERYEGQDLRVWEIDLPVVNEHKRNRLTALAKHEPIIIDADLTHSDVEDLLLNTLHENEFGLDNPAVVIAEGLLYYLDRKTSGRRLLSAAAKIASTHGAIIFDDMVGSSKLRDEGRATMAAHGAPEADSVQLAWWIQAMDDLGLECRLFGNLVALDRWSLLAPFRGDIRSSLIHADVRRANDRVASPT